MQPGEKKALWGPNSSLQVPVSSLSRRQSWMLHSGFNLSVCQVPTKPLCHSRFSTGQEEKIQRESHGSRYRQFNIEKQGLCTEAKENKNIYSLIPTSR